MTYCENALGKHMAMSVGSTVVFMGMVIGAGLAMITAAGLPPSGDGIPYMAIKSLLCMGCGGCGVDPGADEGEDEHEGENGVEGEGESAHEGETADEGEGEPAHEGETADEGEAIEGEPAQPGISVAPVAQVVSSSAGVAALSVLNTGAEEASWQAVVVTGVEWLSLQPDSGVLSPGDTGGISAAYTQNPTHDERIAVLQVTDARAPDAPVEAHIRQEAGSGEPPVPLHIVNRQRVNPYNVIHVPRPNPGVTHVPLLTDFFIMVGTEHAADEVEADSVSVMLEPEGGDAFPILARNQQFPAGYSGVLFPTNDGRYGPALAIYVDSEVALMPDTRYRIMVAAESTLGASLPEEEQSWHFTTEQAPATHILEYALDLRKAPDVEWQGEFFNALAKPAFCTSSRSRLPHYDLIADAQKRFPHAWNLQRDAYLAGFEHQPDPFKNFPNIVREQETRRITAMTRDEDSVLLHVEDFFGHAQYGIVSGRPVSEDYHPGNEVLIADGVNSARTFVIAAHDVEGVVQVAEFEDPAAGWMIEYVRPLPETENPDAPGLFPPGGTYLRKFDPVGTPRYYWGRVNHEWDIVHGTYGRRVIPRFAGAIGCLAIDGRSGTTAKDLAQHHEVTRVITRHLIERYGDATLDWPWVILNEPDLMSVYWRNEDWEELQRFYDYTADAILRAFEDCGYDSEQVRVGGLELGAIWGARHLRLDDFLFHCSPNVDSEDALTLNAAYADPRLDGKRSARVERLCGESGGMGSPLDFLSVHTYNASNTAAEKLVRSKERALEIDPEYYAELPVVSHETVPTWRRILDPGAAGMYLGNGYFNSWMADFQGRLLQQGAKDKRYAHGGDLILMHWPGIIRNFDALNDTVREMRLADRTEVIPSPAFHFVNLLSTLRHRYWVFPLEQIGAHAVSGFASATDEDLRIILYAHHHEDTASRSDASFEIVLTLQGVDGDRVAVEEYRFDREHNSYYHLAQAYRAASVSERNRIYTEQEFLVIQEQARLRVTADAAYPVDNAGQVRFPLHIAANGASCVIVKAQSE